MRGKRALMVVLSVALPYLCPAYALGAEQKSSCVLCHEKVTSGIVKEWASSAMREGMDCQDCHGSAHQSAQDAKKAELPTPELCGSCHSTQYKQYADGKHALAWVAMEAMPTTGFQPHPYIEGLKGCGGCHRIGLRKAESRGAYRYGMACISCHTRHRFSRGEAQSPQACRMCHMGFDHPQWEMWSSSKHGAIYFTDPNSGRAPTCQACHMEEGNHRVMTAWGFLALRLPEADAEWMGYRTMILKGLQVLDPAGNPTPRLEVVKAGKVARLTAAEWQAERDRMLKTCTRCHSSQFARVNLENADAMIKEADRLMAKGIDLVAGLYQDGIIQPQPGKLAYPDVLTFYDAITPIEQKLYVMFLEHRMRTFQGAFHNNPDYVTWYGLAELKKDLVEMTRDAHEMRRQREK
ncbi:MAG: multiheme c-type cytochrome [candidate division NC10 bacterium]|nr:multiheme c-type cytochrome [candidate division NC10 bacterium]